MALDFSTKVTAEFKVTKVNTIKYMVYCSGCLTNGQIINKPLTSLYSLNILKQFSIYDVEDIRNAFQTSAIDLFLLKKSKQMKDL